MTLREAPIGFSVSGTPVIPSKRATHFVGRLAGRSRQRATALFALSLILPLGAYVVLSSRLIAAHVGYEMDEALYVESAVFMLRAAARLPLFL